MTELLDDTLYLDFLAKSHPTLALSRERLVVPSFFAPLDIREPLLPGGVVRGFADVLSKIAPGQMKPRALFLGTPFERYDQSSFLDQVSDPRALLADAVEVARSNRCELVVLTNVDPEHPLLPAWTQHGAKILPSFPDTLVDLGSTTFEDHLATLPGADRSGIRRNIRHFDDAGHTLTRLVDTTAEADALFDCYLPYFEKATVQWFPHTHEYFAALGTLDDRVRVHVARTPADELIGFIVNFVDNQGFQSGRIGVRPDFHRKDSVYFRLMYSVLEDTIENGGGVLSLEPTGYRMKRHLGARAKPLVNVCLGVSATWRMLLGGFSGVGAMLLSHLEHAPTLEDKY